MTVAELKKLIKAIPREYNDFPISANSKELVGLITYPILSEYYDEEFNLELVTRDKVDVKNPPPRPAHKREPVKKAEEK